MKEGSIQYHIGVHPPSGNVMLDFLGKPPEILYMTVAQAKELAVGIVEAIKDAERGRATLVTEGSPKIIVPSRLT